MEPVLVLIGLIVLAIPVSIITLMVSHVRLRRRVEQLEKQLAHPKSDNVLGAEDAKPTEPAPWGAPKKRKTPAPTTAADAGIKSAETPQEPGMLARFVGWMSENWFYAISAVSLGLAGIFLVQYGVESGLLPPTARVGAALLFGAVLIAAGKYLRRRFGDDETSTTANLPSVFSGAGLVTLFGAILAARLLYDLIGAEISLIGLVLVALMALVLGWFHSALLAAVGVIGAFVAPFLVGGSSDDITWLYGYFLIAAALGLGIDAFRQWRWISALSLIGGYGASALLVLTEPNTEPGFMIMVTALALFALAIPVRKLWPNHSGPMVSEAVAKVKDANWPHFPTLLALGAVLVTSLALSMQWPGTPAEFWLTLFLHLILLAALILWASGARALQDLAVIPAIGMISFVFLQGLDGGVVAAEFWQTYAETNEADYPWSVTTLVGFAAVVSLAAAWRSFQGGRYAKVWAAGAAIFAPALAIGLELGWQPAQVIGSFPWALHAVALAAVMVVLAQRFAGQDGDDRMRVALVTLSALSCLTFACVIMLSSAALTVALVAMIVVAAVLDRAFVLPPMSWFIWAGVFTVTVRLVLNPGLDWADTAPLWEMILVYLSATLGFLLAWRVIRPLPRPIAHVLLESASWATGGILISLLLLRWLEGFGEGGAKDSHWGLGLLATIWLLLAYAQVQRFRLGGRLTYVRYALALFFAGHGVFRLSQALSEANPLISLDADPVLGLPVLNTLAIAYLLPALVAAFWAWKIPSMQVWLARISYGAAAVLSAIWLGLTIRHFWQGATQMYEGFGVTQPELYSYTVALLLVGGTIFYQSLARGSGLMRKVGLVVIGLAIAKVFLIDIAGLGGLIRVFSLLLLGLALAGLAWLNRWASLRHSPQGPEPLDH